MPWINAGRSLKAENMNSALITGTHEPMICRRKVDAVYVCSVRTPSKLLKQTQPFYIRL
ncbi:hypothetical protein Mapa_010956 [Marchantia paleacea]|nr:hypothetical protein Mapa_010956 [Marchantia paleacea]